MMTRFLITQFSVAEYGFEVEEVCLVLFDKEFIF